MLQAYSKAVRSSLYLFVSLVYAPMHDAEARCSRMLHGTKPQSVHIFSANTPFVDLANTDELSLFARSQQKILQHGILLHNDETRI